MEVSYYNCMAKSKVWVPDYKIWKEKISLYVYNPLFETLGTIWVLF